MQEPKIDPKKTALIVGHFQNDLINTDTPPYNELTRMAREHRVIESMAKVIAGMRQANIPIMFITLL